VAAGVAAVALVLSSGLAGAYATTRLEDSPAAVATTTVTAATTTRAATGSLAAVAAQVTPSVAGTDPVTAGIVSALRRTITVGDSDRSAGSIGVGFAIPGNQARQVADRLLAAT
jgi:hypothetical protein